MRNKYMAWKQLEYSKNRVDRAGVRVSEMENTSDEYKEELKVVDNYRAAHGYPLYIITNKLKRMTSGKDIFVVYRLKRLDSIVAKLKRNEHMSLKNMQDLGGCRVVVPNIMDVYKIADEFENSRVRHKLVKENDYIKEPKKDGYRSLHRVYKYVSDDKESPYNGMKIEIQFRTLTQHYWATAVETMGICTKTNLKAGIGDEGVKRFFVLASNLLAMSEAQNLIPGTSGSLKENVLEIKEIDEKLHILNKLKAISTMVRVTKDIKKAGYYLLNLDLDKMFLNITEYKTNEFKKAVADYDFLECFGNEKNDVVLVSATSAKELKKAYPNYFGDIRHFIKKIEKIISIYN